VAHVAHRPLLRAWIIFSSSYSYFRFFQRFVYTTRSETNPVCHLPWGIRKFRFFFDWASVSKEGIEAMRKAIAFLVHPRFLLLFLVLSIFLIFAYTGSTTTYGSTTSKLVSNLTLSSYTVVIWICFGQLGLVSGVMMVLVWVWWCLVLFVFSLFALIWTFHCNRLPRCLNLYFLFSDRMKLKCAFLSF